MAWVLALAAGPPARAAAARTAQPAVPPPPAIPAGRAGAPFRTRGMWIWVLGGQSLSSIIETAKAYGIGMLMIKSGDGSSTWSQFNPTLVSSLHAAGIRVCAWQYVYGSQPKLEAEVGAYAVRAGADCLLIDAEAEYQGKYVQAQTYMQTLRKLIGPNFPLALAGLPYVDYHPAFPYSVFLGPGGAQYNVPQMYWRAIGTTVDAVYAHTYEFNQLYQRPIAPLGQVYDSPPVRQIRRFRSISRYYGAAGLSWWDWSNAGVQQLQGISDSAGPIRGFVPQTTVASLGFGALGDVVVWAQEHLVSAGFPLAIDGDFGPKTMSAVERFQTAHGLPATGLIDAATWDALLRYRPVAVKWVQRKRGPAATIVRPAIARRGLEVLPVPRSASVRQRDDELAGAPGRGRPGH